MRQLALVLVLCVFSGCSLMASRRRQRQNLTLVPRQAVLLIRRRSRKRSWSSLTSALQPGWMALRCTTDSLTGTQQSR